MKLARPDKASLLSRASLGTWLTIPHPSVAEIAVRAGFEWVTVDLEHSPIGIESCAELLRVIDLAGARPFVRVGSHDPNVIKRVMDAGAHGIIVPTVNSPEEAASVVGAAKYPPLGRRGVGLSRAQGYSEEFDEHYRWLNSESMVFVQIEHAKAVENIDEILGVEGVDGYFVGPYDLSASLGIPGQFDHPRYIEALEAVRASASRRGTPMGVHVVQPDVEAARAKIAQGYRLVAFGIDYLFMLNSAKERLREIRS